jgi:molybdate transport system substrate-binding protein
MPKVMVVLVLIGLLSSLPLAAAQEVTVAVAANFILPFEELAGLFEKKTGIRVKGIFTSTGNLYAQIKNGAPYDLFLAADEARPRLLHKEGLAGEPFIYARGRVVLWTAMDSLCRVETWQKMVISPSVRRLAIANPETAPYGAASVEALRGTGLWEAVKPKLVFAQNIVQAFQYAHTLSADAGFCALSSALSEKGKAGCYRGIPEAPDVIQAACLLKKTGENKAIEEFAAFLASPEARVIKEKYGYE